MLPSIGTSTTSGEIRLAPLPAVGRHNSRHIDKLRCNMHEREGRSPSMLAFIVAIIVLGLTYVIGTLVMFRYGLSDNQSLPPSTAAEATWTLGTLIAFAIAASHWLQLGWWW
jgi:hypothetical protein